MALQIHIKFLIVDLIELYQVIKSGNTTSGFYLGFFCLGEVDPEKKFFSHAAARKNFWAFWGVRGMLPWKILKVWMHGTRHKGTFQLFQSSVNGLSSSAAAFVSYSGSGRPPPRSFENRWRNTDISYIILKRIVWKFRFCLNFSKIF